MSNEPIEFGDFNNKFISCDSKACKLFKSLDEVRKSYDKGEIMHIRIIANTPPKGDWLVNLNDAKFEKNPFGKNVLKVPETAVQQYREESVNTTNKGKVKIV
ncbi:MAG: hypothetical protein Q7S22_00570 [Candidatus Micrarchaeota archaeon]|nr:hypothetical protein [Candidatus Micrarchaeota archaeon]